MKVIVQTTRETVLTPELMAQAFWEMTSEEQGEFFSCLGRIPHIDFETQMHAAKNDTSAAGVEVMKTIGEAQ